jgi:hypothetical protein
LLQLGDAEEKRCKAPLEEKKKAAEKEPEKKKRLPVQPFLVADKLLLPGFREGCRRLEKAKALMEKELQGGVVVPNTQPDQGALPATDSQQMDGLCIDESQMDESQF